jgi:Uma2 family endonuclease
MATVSDTPVPIWTASKVIAHFGDIPITRIRTSPPPGEATEADVVALHDSHDRLFELVDGVLVEKTKGFRESTLAAWIATLLNQFVRPRGLGKVSGADGMYRLEPELIRIPDVAFISRERYVGKKLQSGAFWELGCDLAVEVISPSNTRREMERKLDDYFQAGVQLVWLVYPDRREVVVYSSPHHSAMFKEGDTLDGGKILPGFQSPISEIFSALE